MNNEQANAAADPQAMPMDPNYIIPPFLVYQFEKDITDRENMELFYNHKVPHWVPNYYADFNFRGPLKLDYDRPGGGIGTSGFDWFGQEWVFVPEAGAPMVKPGAPFITDITKWETQIKFPDLDSIDWEKDAAGYKQFDNKDRMNACIAVQGPFERLHDMLGFEETLIAFLEEPEAVSDFISAMADFKIKYFKILRDYYDVDVVCAHDDLASAANGFFSVEIFNKILKPHYKRMVDAVHDLGMYYQFHSCGKAQMYVPELVDIGVDCWESAQVMNDLMKIKKEYGDKLLIAGGMDSQGVIDVIGISEEEIRQHVRAQIDQLAPGGGFMPTGFFTTGGMVTMVDEIARYGSTFYKK
ncbi:uroporphyrinogen decarboxylase family protein [Acetobacterium tundrae]|uniref:Uroporphyrinogen decarboxylase (URO-D) domain-containing protein n=1 Tax=Acetobacterium tundrae TaxID=132932 RepID=A0ABR6WP32_9FIRM|nr:uroporphyrinogen decarboxylase family protein [Acetobacterium tundrae]MBC3798248.1 hypothetical protein [Acetobacterium tundrae]